MGKYQKKSLNLAKQIQSNKPLNINQIPSNMKELIKCEKCGSTLWKQRIEWYRLKQGEEIGYTSVIVNICDECGNKLPEKP